jgi:hypothetical protein
MKKSKKVVISVDLTTLKNDNYFSIKNKEFGENFKFRRMPHNDILAVYGKNHIQILSYSEQDKEFEMSHMFKNVHKGKIDDLVFSGDFLFSCCSSDKSVHQIKMRNKQSLAKDNAKQMKNWIKDDAAKKMARVSYFDKLDPADSARDMNTARSSRK